MKTKEKVKKELENLRVLGQKLIKTFVGKDFKKRIDFNSVYQQWYSKALVIIRTFAHDRLTDFLSYYKIDPKRKNILYSNYVIEDYLKGSRPLLSSFDPEELTLQNFYNQFTILHSISDRIDSVFDDLVSNISLEVHEDSLDASETLKKVNARAAGALAGVILEAHLQSVAKSRNVAISKKNPTISDLNDPLKQAEVYGTPEWRKISYLGDIRNLCSHKKDSEPTLAQVTELIDGVRWAIKNVL